MEFIKLRGQSLPAGAPGSARGGVRSMLGTGGARSPGSLRWRKQGEDQVLWDFDPILRCLGPLPPPPF